MPKPKRNFIALDIDFFEDLRIRQLSEVRQLQYIRLLCIAGKERKGGLIPYANGVLVRSVTKGRHDYFDAAIKQMASIGLVDIRKDGIFILKFTEWQSRLFGASSAPKLEAQVQPDLPSKSPELEGQVRASREQVGSKSPILTQENSGTLNELKEIERYIEDEEQQIPQNTIGQVFDLWERINGKKPSTAVMEQLDDFGQLADTFRRSLAEANPWRPKEGTTWLFTALERGRDGTKTGNISINYVKAILRSMCAEAQALDTIKQSNGKDGMVTGWNPHTGELLYS